MYEINNSRVSSLSYSTGRTAIYDAECDLLAIDKFLYLYVPVFWLWVRHAYAWHDNASVCVNKQVANKQNALQAQVQSVPFDRSRLQAKQLDN